MWLGVDSFTSSSLERGRLLTGKDGPYDVDFYEGHAGGSARSAEAIVPLVLGALEVDSVVDVGCGIGTWLSVFQDHGVTDVLGIDGDYVPRDLLKIPPESFRSHDLSTPLNMNRQFDLVVSLEVAEHLPARCAEMFVDSLTGLGPVVLFSAAVPHQGGTGHVNEQWQDYWAGLFAKRDYEVVDCIRPHVWDQDGVNFWYKQNTLLYVSAEALDSHPVLQREAMCRLPLSIAHPTTVAHAASPPGGARKLAGMTLGAIGAAVSRRLRRVFSRGHR